MIDLRPPYPWEKQPTKPKEESGLAVIVTVAMVLIAFWLMSIAFNPMLG